MLYTKDIYSTLEHIQSIIFILQNQTVSQKRVLNQTVSQKRVINQTVSQKRVLNQTVSQKRVLNQTVSQKRVLNAKIKSFFMKLQQKIILITFAHLFMGNV